MRFHAMLPTGRASWRCSRKWKNDYKRLDILVNNAGITRDKLLPVMTDEQWDEIIAANLPVASVFPRSWPIDDAAKVWPNHQYVECFGVDWKCRTNQLFGHQSWDDRFTRSMSKELAKRKVTVNAIAPGFIESEMTKALGAELIDKVKERCSGGSTGVRLTMWLPVRVFLASKAASYITGQVLTVDGG